MEEKERFFEVIAIASNKNEENKVFYIRGYIDSITAAKKVAALVKNREENTISFELLFKTIKSVKELYFCK